jgi:hypothetical protein
VSGCTVEQLLPSQSQSRRAPAFYGEAMAALKRIYSLP